MHGAPCIPRPHRLLYNNGNIVTGTVPSEMGALTALNRLYVQGGATAARPSPAARVAALWEGVWSDACK